MSEPLYRCLACRDTSYVPGRPKQFAGYTYESVKPCLDCDAGRYVKRRWDLEAETRKKLKLRPHDPIPEKQRKTIANTLRAERGERAETDNLDQPETDQPRRDDPW